MREKRSHGAERLHLNAVDIGGFVTMAMVFCTNNDIKQTFVSRDSLGAGRHHPSSNRQKQIFVLD